MELLLALYRWVMDYGYVSYSLRLARRERPGYRNLLDGFYTIGRALAVNVLSSLFVLLWGLIGLGGYPGLLVPGPFLFTILPRPPKAWGRISGGPLL